MVAIPKIQDPTLAAMREAMERKNVAERKARSYLGASLLGQSCSRRIWYSINDYPSEPINSIGLMAIQDGFTSESVLAERLRLVPGIELWTHGEDGEQIGYSDGRQSGHVDGVILGLLQAPKTPHVWESKACNEKKFKLFQKAKEEHGEKQALAKWDTVYFAQAQLYMHHLELTRHYLTVCTPGARDVDSCRTEYNKDVAEGLISKGNRIISAKGPPERIGGRDWYECRYCPFREVCHGN